MKLKGTELVNYLLACGWDSEPVCDEDLFSCHVFYLRDERNSTVQLFLIPMSEFREFNSHDELTMRMIKSALLKLIGSVERIQCISGDIAFKKVICGIVKSSTCYEAWIASHTENEQLHGVINIDAKNQIRFSIFKGEASVQTPDSVVAHCLMNQHLF
ncbi:hypothetical protein SAMN04488136_11648 [Vibrio xiamenensis]|uniref:Uncharacterized protein n=1 Tax=Vibrio xiamenensis TaxID=861298 RepID=A0A1G8CHH0_9VIBR|nr:hypothetical protein [Vibrio xiamenensis]SDH44370.1 hypothetical protein SAMN04488136_11648 [Vibrio xiamenensis]